MGNGVPIPVHSSKIHDHIKTLKGLKELRDFIDFKVVELLISIRIFLLIVMQTKMELKVKSLEVIVCKNYSSIFDERK